MRFIILGDYIGSVIASSRSPTETVMIPIN